MHLTTFPPPSPEKTPPQNPHTPTDAFIQASAFHCFRQGEPSASRNLDNFKALVVKLAGRLLPAHQSLIDQRFDHILPDELLVPDHPPYADMILTALWELKAEGGSSVEDISHFIEREYHELPWAHATILNHHLRELCKKGKITKTHDRCYIRCSLITNPEPNPSACLSPLSSAYSSSSASIPTSPSSSSSSLGWGGSYRKQKRKKVKQRRGKRVQVKGTDRGRGRRRGRSTSAMIIQVGQRRRGGRNKVEEPKQGTEDQNEVTNMEVQDYSNKDGDAADVIAKTSDEENLPCEQDNKDQYQQQKKDSATGIAQEARKLKEAEIDTLNVPSDDEVTVVEVDVGDDKEDEHVEQLEQKEEKGATDIELDLNRQEDNQQSDTVETQTFGEEQLMDDENLSEEQDSVMIQCEAQETAACLEKKNGDTFEEQIQSEENKEEFETHEQQGGDDEQKPVEKQVEMGTAEKIELNKQLDHLTKEQVETKEQSADLHDGDDDDVSVEPIHPQEQCVEKTEESPQSCQQWDQLKNIEAVSAEQEEQQTELNQKEIVLAELQQEQFVEMIEQQNQHCIHQTEISKKDSLLEKNNPVRNEENTTSSSNTTEGSRRPSRPGLRSSCKKEDAAPNSKKQLELVTPPVRRSLRSHKTISEATVITEVPDHSKEQLTNSGRTRSSKRKPGIAEAEQVPSTRKTRRTGL